MITNELSGIYHAGGKHRLSLYEIAQSVNRVGGYDPENVMGCYRREAGPMPPRAGNVTMVSTQIREALGYEPFDPWPLDSRWLPTDRDWHQRPETSGGSEELLAEILYRNPRRRTAAS